MKFKDQREIVRLRFLLRTLVAEGRRLEARAALERLRGFVQRDEREALALAAELSRWEHRIAA